MTPHPPEDALAALRDGGRFERDRGRRPLRVKLDAGPSIEAPGPLTLAETFVLPWLAERGLDVFRQGSALLCRPSGSQGRPEPLDMVALASELRERLSALPDRADAGRPYRDVRFLATVAEPGTRDPYLADSLRAARRLAPAWTDPKPRAARVSVARSDAERKAAQRAREAEVEAASARYWLTELFLGDEDEPPTPGDRVLAADLFELAVDALTDLAESEEPLDEDDDESPLARAPRERIFYAVADEILGARTRGGANGARTYTIPDPDAPTPDEETATVNPETPDLASIVLDRVVDKIAAEVREEILARHRSGDLLGALTLQRDAHAAATGTDGAVVDFATVRARRGL